MPLADILGSTQNADGNPCPVRIIPKGVSRGLYETYADSTLERILEQHGEAHLRLVLATIMQSEGNHDALTGPIIDAVSSAILAHPEWLGNMTKWMDAFDLIRLPDLFEEAKAVRGRLKQPSKGMALYMLLSDRLSVMLTDEHVA